MQSGDCNIKYKDISMKVALELPPNLEQTRLSDAVYETLLDAILSGRLCAGSVVSEVALSKQLEVSRTPVHDALRQLSKDGLIEQRANHRAVIATFAREDVHDVFEMRKILEGEAAYRAATRLDRPELARLRSEGDNLARSRKRPDWVERWADFDEDFHTSVARASGSKRLYQDIIRYRMLHRGFNLLTTTVECLKQALDEHFCILESLENRKADEARQRMVSHIQEWQAFFVNRFPHR
ncbi:MAG: GntR family transcriptional regulator [Gemmataceae bacterium]